MYLEESARTSEFHSDSIAVEMKVDDGIRKKSLHSVGIAEAVSPVRKVEPKRIAATWRHIQ